MPTPLYCLRLPQETQDALVVFGKIYGAPHGRAFARELLETVTCGDSGRLVAFVERLAQRTKMAVQMNLEFSAKPLAKAPETPVAAKKSPKKRKNHARP